MARHGIDHRRELSYVGTNVWLILIQRIKNLNSRVTDYEYCEGRARMKCVEVATDDAVASRARALRRSRRTGAATGAGQTSHSGAAALVTELKSPFLLPIAPAAR